MSAVEQRLVYSWYWYECVWCPWWTSVPPLLPLHLEREHPRMVRTDSKGGTVTFEEMRGLAARYTPLYGHPMERGR